MRPLIDFAYRMRLRILALLRWRTRGVKVMAFDPTGRLLLVRHRYGRSDLWMLPGGGIARAEAPEVAAVRELAEETGCRLDAVVPIGRYESGSEGRRDTVHLFHALTAGEPFIDAVELAEGAVLRTRCPAGHAVAGDAAAGGRVGRGAATGWPVVAGGSMSWWLADSEPLLTSPSGSFSATSRLRGGTGLVYA